MKPRTITVKTGSAANRRTRIVMLDPRAKQKPRGPLLRQSLARSRINVDMDREKLNPATNRYETDPNDDLWRVNWKEFGFEYCGIYVITPKAGWPVKIGISSHAASRLLSLQTAHWNELIVARYWICETRNSAMKVERAAHRRLQRVGNHLLGEWFDARAEDAERIVGIAADQAGVQIPTRLPPSEKFDKVFAALKIGEEQRDQMWHAHLMEEVFGGDFPL
jgi:hypothetical protein